MASEQQQPKRPARRKRTEAGEVEKAKWAASSVGLDNDTHAGLSRAAKKLRTSNAQYAAAAIRYFLELGLDPRKAAGLREGPLTRQKVSESAQQVLQRNDENTNRLITVLRAVERQVYSYQQQTSLALLDYMARVEGGNLAYLVDLEKQVLAPLLELVLRGTVEAQMARMTGTVILHVGQRGEKREDMAEKHRQYDEQRDRRIAEELGALVKKWSVIQPTLTPKPPLPAPPGAPAKSAPEPDYY